MHWIGYAGLAAAVSNAGGLGMVTALTQPSPADLAQEIRKCHNLTKKPFGVNITLLPTLIPPDYGAYVQTIIQEGVKVVETAGNNPGPVIKQLKQAGVIVIHKCTTLRHAHSAVKLGVDFLSIDGFECGGHVGEHDITSLILLGRARQELGVPFIASGGFIDGYGLAAAMALGAEGINMGTRLMCTVESSIHSKVKEAIVAAQETDTALVMRRWSNTTRLFANRVAKAALSIEKESAAGQFEEIAPLVWTAGQAVGLIKDIPTCSDLMKRVEMEALSANNECVESIDESEAAVRAAETARARTLGWTDAWSHYGDDFPLFSDKQLEFIKGSADFFSINHYGTLYATGEEFTPARKLGWFTDDEVCKSAKKTGGPDRTAGGPGSANMELFHNYLVPWGFKHLLVHCWERYAQQSNMPIFVYENGYAVENESSMSLEDIVNDVHRQEYHNLYIKALCDAVIDNGVHVEGYHAWSLLEYVLLSHLPLSPLSLWESSVSWGSRFENDALNPSPKALISTKICSNLEWNWGFGPRFGVTFVDHENQFKRIPKKSGAIMKAIWEHIIDN
ncbi:hypothetical protein AnigIFM63604_009377 [Aspergillus niger]|uniref:alpha-galactosidase n=1 Tax=Aspergillus niger TaxID=5061 RepID=A0A9W6A2I1_ASPNG|nr:hypothetical protein AnigIFM63604_009377 [Aspergillus niger]